MSSCDIHTDFWFGSTMFDTSLACRMFTRSFGFLTLYFMWCVITKEPVMETFDVVLTFHSVDGILWCDHSNETNLAVVVHGNVTEGRKLYISRSGDDTWSCVQSKPCRNIWRAVTLASDGDYIYLDGTNTSKDPYTCQSRTPDHPGIYVNNSLSLIGFASPMPQIRCSEETGLMFNGSDNAEKMRVTLSGLLLSKSFVSFQDSFVDINGCKFEGSKQAVKIVKRTSIISSIRITNSTFSGNSECISVVLNSTKRSPSQYIQVMFKVTNSSFDSNVLSDDGQCISFTAFPSSNQSIRCNISLENVTFSRNKFSSKGLVFLDMNNGSQHINFQNVTFVDNSPLSGRAVLTVNGDSECSFRGTVLNISINSSSFTSERARSFNVNASRISLQICNSSFLGHLAQGNGGVVSLRGTDLCNISVYKSSFINTTAAQGGAVNLECASVNSVRFEDSIFSGNTATDGGGGAVYISALKASVRLNHSAFTACTASHGGGVSIETSTNLSKRNPNNTDLLLIVESSNFTGCSAHLEGGALNVNYQTGVQICFNNSHFIFNVVEFGFGGGAIMVSSLEKTKGRNSTNSQITIQRSTFANNRARQGGALWLLLNSQSSLIFRNVVMKSNEVTERFGGVAVIEECRVKVQSSRFLNNLAGYDGGVFWIVGNVHSLDVLDSLFESNSVLSHSGGAFIIQMGSVFQSILIINSTFNNCSAQYNAGAIYIISGNASIVIKRSRFTKNHCEYGSGGALHVSAGAGSQLKVAGCIKNSTGNQNNDVREYNTRLIIEDTVFERNFGLFGGAIYLDNGQATFHNCSFIDNFAGLKGGHIYLTFGFASLVIQHSIFCQTVNELKRQKMNHSNTMILFIQAENVLTLKLHNTTLDLRPYGSTVPLMQVTNGRLIDLGNDNLTTKFNCPLGSQMKILNITVMRLTTLEFSCSACAENSYSLQRGRALGSQVVPGFQCLACPFGANCSRNILAKSNFWGFKERLNPPTLKFTMCPYGYCSPPNETDFPEYNGCQGDRSGKLCGHCNTSCTETLYSTDCRPSHNCNDFWFWPVAFVYVSFMAFYFIFKPPIVPWIKRQILWFKKYEMANTDQNDNFDRGYVKIVFYFYQAANLLLVSTSSQHIFKTEFINIFVGLFNFQEKVSSSGLICPFPGLTVVTKQLFSAFYVFGTCLMIGAVYLLHWVVQKCRGQETPSVGPYIGAFLQAMLLGYTTLASVSFNLLRCVPIGSEKRLFYDENVVCYQRWQYILIAFICIFFIPFVFFLLWGSFKLYYKSLSVGMFLLACCFPLPCLLYWAFLSLFCNPPNEDTPQSQNTSLKYIEMVLYDSFKRPEDGGTRMALSWESVMIGRRLFLIVLKAFISDPMPRLLAMSFFCVLFLQHHLMTQPFVHGIANTVETISLLSIVLLGMVNMFFASFVSLAVPLSHHFGPWWNVCQVVEIVILCAVPAVFGFLVVAACLSQVCRLTVAVCRLLYDFLFICFGWCYRKGGEEMRPLEASARRNILFS